MTTVAVKPELIRWAINRSGLPTVELLAKFPKLEEWSSGERQPTFRQLEMFARATMTPFGMMFLDAPPKEELPVPDFRTRNDAPLGRYSPNLLDTNQIMQRRQAWLCEWLNDEGTQKLDFLASAAITDNFKSLAQRIRKRLDLDAEWAEGLPTWEDSLQFLKKAIERVGIFVFSNGVVGLNNIAPSTPMSFAVLSCATPSLP